MEAFMKKLLLLSLFACTLVPVAAADKVVFECYEKAFGREKAEKYRASFAAHQANCNGPVNTKSGPNPDHNCLVSGLVLSFVEDVMKNDRNMQLCLYQKISSI